MLEAYQRDLAIDGPLISTNGAAIVHSREHKILTSHPINRQTALTILEYADDCHFDYSALTGSACYFSQNSIRIRRFLQYNEIAAAREMDLIPIIYFNGRNDIVKGEIYKILIQELHPGDFGKASEFLQSIDGISCTSSESGLIDIMKTKVDKGTGVAELRQILGVKKENVCVFGDYLNDLPMFFEAGFPVAMGNAHETLKENAVAITDHYDNDGIAKAIYEYIL